MEKPGFGRALVAGVVAWVVFTLLLEMAPAMGLPKMNVPAMLGGMFGINSIVAGWMVHFVIGVGLIVLYAYVFADRLAGPAWLRGMQFAVLPWLLMMAIVAPMLGILDPMLSNMPPGFFMIHLGVMAPMGSLVAHLVYGAVGGAVYGFAAAVRRAAA
jgi:hypothetical protein